MLSKGTLKLPPAAQNNSVKFSNTQCKKCNDLLQHNKLSKYIRCGHGAKIKFITGGHPGMLKKRNVN